MHIQVQAQNSVFEGTCTEASLASEKNILTICVEGGNGADGKTKYSALEYAQRLVKMFNSETHTKFPTQVTAYYNESNGDKPTSAAVYMNGNIYRRDGKVYFPIYIVGKLLNEIAEDYAVLNGLAIKQEVKDLMEKAKLNDPVSLHELSLCYYYGRGIKQNRPLGKKYLFESANLGHGVAQDLLGQSYKLGIRDFPKDKELAYQWLTKSYLNGGGTSIQDLRLLELEIGRDYLRQALETSSDLMIIKNCEEAKKWVQLGVDKKHPEAYHVLGWVLMTQSTAQIGKEKDDNKVRGLTNIAMACELGVSEACETLNEHK